MYMEVPIMKLSHILILILVAAALVFTGCDSAGTGGGGDVDYKVEFKLDGTQHSLTGGYNDLSGPPEGAYQSIEAATYTLIGATPAGASDTSEFLGICIPDTETGTYLDANYSAGFEWYFDYAGVFYEADPGAKDFSIRLTKIEPIGGVIEGTFSGTASTPGVTGDGTYSITNGFFRVKRLEDDALFDVID
jgi:predicted small secreted protein